jgi:F0F1-type ATP synthase assembly protein I
VGAAVSHTVVLVLALQLGAALAGGLLFLLFSTANAALSALAGGLTCFIAGLPYALRVSATRAASPMHTLMVHGFGEFSKILISLVAMGVLLYKFETIISPLPMLTTYFAAALSYWVALILPK